MNYNLVPERDSDGNETGYYTREPDGASGMTISALAEFCGLAAGSTTAISNLLDRIKAADPETNDLPESLKDLAGKDLRLETNDPSGRLLIQDEACFAIAEYYAFDARAYEGKSIAVRNYRTVGRPGMRVFIWSRTGYVPPEFRQQRESVRGTYWYQRVKLALSDTTMPLQAGYFCAYLEMMKFFQELEVHADYIVLDTDPVTKKYIVPDISIGQLFNKWLRDPGTQARQARLDFLGSEEIIDFRKERFNNSKSGGRILLPEGLHRSEIKEYNHIYPQDSHGDNNRWPVNSYPDKYLSIFKYYLHSVWIPLHCKRYISERDPVGWKLAEQRLAQLPSATRIALSGTLIGSLLPALTPSS